MMGIALRMARRGLGRVAPNPAVGAVIADEASGEVIARGWTQPGGRPHAETEAIRRAGARARGATMYVTLEPCSHQGQTGPCASAIIAAGLKRVVVAIEDPDTRVAGRGLAVLREAGIDVATGVRADEARLLTLGHILRVTQHRPFVQLKLALSADGSVPRGGEGQATWVTSPEARAHGALLRAQADAILVGARTVVDDDPQLTCRLPGLADRSPVRVAVSATLNVPLTAKVFASARDVPTWVVCSDRVPGEKVEAFTRLGVQVVQVPPAGESGVAVPALVSALAGRGITRLLVEGGPRTWRAFSEAGIVDEVVGYQARGEESDATRAAATFINLDGFSLTAEQRLARDDVAVFRARR
jgi:diaminohydroxyphosphoribosylaminopyrimidine deaminase/5-amino-6-(5-phosphoribosylamino)uracil reductase